MGSDVKVNEEFLKVAEKLRKTFQGMTEKQIEDKYNVKNLENVPLTLEWHAARSGYFLHYLKGYGEPNMSFQDAAYSIQKHLREFGINKMKVLDCGCGFGFQSIMFSLFGNNVTSITFDKEEASIFSKIIKGINKNENGKDCLPVLGDAVDLPFRDSYFDVAWLQEFISHVSSVIGVVQEAYRVLRNGGIIIVKDTSNLNLRARYIHFMSHIKDKHWENLYKEKRRRITTEFLEKSKVTLSDRVIDDIAENTAGLTRTQIEDLLLDMYGKSDIKQLVKKYDCNFKYRDPTTGFYNERLFYTYRIRRSLLRVGFRNVTIGIPCVEDPKFRFLNNPSLRKIMQRPIFRLFYEVAVGSNYWVYAFK